MSGIRVRHELRADASTDRSLRDQARIYARGRTPAVDSAGRLHSLDVRPAGPSETGRQLVSIFGRFGSHGMAKSIRALALSREAGFAAAALESMPTRLGDVVRASDSGRPLPAPVSDGLGAVAGRPVDHVRVHADPSAHRAADLLGAQAFTIGRDIYLAKGAYAPDSATGAHLLAHEVAHALQQSVSTSYAPDGLRVIDPGHSSEHEAERFARHASGGRRSPGSTGPLRRVPVSIQRAISFTRAKDRIDKSTMIVQPKPADWQIVPKAAPLFSYTADVTIHGAPGDKFANFEIGPLQVVRAFWVDVYWGTDKDRTVRKGRITKLPAHDEATVGGTPWYSNWRASAPFAKDGDVRTTTLADSPLWNPEPWTNPKPPRDGTRGWFNYGAAFVAYIAARDRTAPIAPAAYRPLGFVYWNVSLDGQWDNTKAVPKRMTTTGGAVNVGKPGSGASTEFPPMIGGPAALTLLKETLT